MQSLCQLLMGITIIIIGTLLAPFIIFALLRELGFFPKLPHKKGPQRGRDNKSK